MKRFFLTSVALVSLFGGSAAAADIPLKAPSALPWSWAGFYLGIHGGYGWKNDDFHEFLGTIGGTNFFVGGIDSKGGVFGGHAGYNWQLGWGIGGFEFDFSGTDIKGSSDPVVLNFGGGVSQTVTREDDVKWLGSARVRFGLAPQTFWNGGVLLYGTGGVAWERFTQVNTTFTVAPGISQTVTTTTPNDRFGWVAGTGAEASLFGSNWLIRVEYLHYEFGTSQTPTVVVSNVGGSFAESAHNQRIDVVRGGLSYKF